jgi:hypothetical protein
MSFHSGEEVGRDHTVYIDDVATREFHDYTVSALVRCGKNLSLQFGLIGYD